MEQNLAKFLLKKISIFASCCCALASASLFADTVTDLDIGVSYGMHKINTQAKDTGDLTPVSGGNTFRGPFSQQLKFKTLGLNLKATTLVDDFCFDFKLGYGFILGKTKETLDLSAITSTAGGTPGSMSKESKKARKNGSVFDASFALGYRIKINDTAAFVPYVGLATHRTTVKKYGTPKDSSFHGSATGNQKNTWNSIFVGFKLPVEIGTDLSLIPEVEYHFARAQQKSKSVASTRPYVEGKQPGHIIKAGIKLSYAIDADWKIDFGYNYQHKHSKWKKGNALITGSSTTAPASKTTSKNRAKQTDHVIQLGATYSF